ncbi:MAG: ROK family transcriptional regulator [Spirochaetota bacterium]
MNFTGWRKHFHSSHLRAVHYIWKNPYISRIELSRLMQLNKSSITRIVEELKQWGVVQEESSAAGGQRGRPSVALQLHADLGLFYGVELRPDAYQFVCLRPHGLLEHAQRRRFDAAERQLNFAQRLELVFREVEAIKQDLPILGFGLGLSGIIDSSARHLLISEAHGVAEPLDLRPLINRGKWDCPVRLENDARCCAAWERRRSPSRNFVAVLGELYHDTELRSGSSPIQIGLGFVLGGEVYCGSNFAAGEFQSIFKSEDNFTQFDLKSGEEVGLLKEPLLLYRVFDELCANIAFLVDTLDLEEVRFAGNIISYAQQLSKRLEQAIERQWSHIGAREIPVYFSEQGELAVAMGAATTMQQQCFALEKL